MDGVTILHTAESLTTGSFIVLLAFIFIGIIFTSIGVAQLCYGEWLSGAIFTLIAILAFTICVRISSNYKYKENYYQVIIDEDLKFEEFMSKYEIIDQEGLIYTIKER